MCGLSGKTTKGRSEQKSRASLPTKNDFDVAKTREASLEQSLGVGGQGGANNAVAMRLRELERGVNTNRALYESFLSRAKVSDEQANLEVRQARIINTAIVPNSPSYPSKFSYARWGLFLGLFGGVGAAFLIESVRRGFTTPQEVERILEIPALASVPQLTKATQIDGSVTTPLAYLVKNRCRGSAKKSAPCVPAFRCRMSIIRRRSFRSRPLFLAKEKRQSAYRSHNQRDKFSEGAVCGLRFAASCRNENVRADQEPGLVDLLVGTNPLESVMFQAPDTTFTLLVPGLRRTIHPICCPPPAWNRFTGTAGNF